MATVTLRLPDEFDQALERQSAAAGVSKSDMTREALRRFLDVLTHQVVLLVAGLIFDQFSVRLGGQIPDVRGGPLRVNISL